MLIFLKKFPRLIALGLLTLTMTFPLISKVNSQSINNSLSDQIPNKWPFSPPSRLGVPNRREGGATRAVEMPMFESGGEEQPAPPPRTRGGSLDIFSLPSDDGRWQGDIDNFDQNSCAQNPLIVLVPNTNKTLTASANPNFYWYLPPNDAMGVEFILKDDQNVTLYQTRYLLTENTVNQNTGKIMGLQIPSFGDFSGLEVGKEYVWEVRLICNLLDSSSDNQAVGIVERIEPGDNLISRPSPDTSLAQLNLYVDANLWHETMDTMVNLHREKPNDPEVEAAWQKLIQSAELPEFIDW